MHEDFKTVSSKIRKEISDITKTEEMFNFLDIEYEESSVKYDSSSLVKTAFELARIKNLMEMNASKTIHTYPNEKETVIKNKTLFTKTYNSLIKTHNNLVDSYNIEPEPSRKNKKKIKMFGNGDVYYSRSPQPNGHGKYILSSSSNGEYLYHAYSPIQYYVIGTKAEVIIEPYNQTIIRSILCYDATKRYPIKYEKYVYALQEPDKPSQKESLKSEIINHQRKIYPYLEKKLKIGKQNMTKPLNAFRIDMKLSVKNLKGKIAESVFEYNNAVRKIRQGKEIHPFIFDEIKFKKR